MNEQLITTEEVAALNVARTALQAISARLVKYDVNEGDRWHLFTRGELRSRVETADDAVFDVLNCASSSGLVALADHELHNRVAESLA